MSDLESPSQQPVRRVATGAPSDFAAGGLLSSGPLASGRSAASGDGDGDGERPSRRDDSSGPRSVGGYGSDDGDGDGDGGDDASSGLGESGGPDGAPEAEEDPRLRAAVLHVRRLSSAHLKEQCILTEWAATESELERDQLLVAVKDDSFWGEVRRMTTDDLATMPHAAEGGADDGGLDVDAQLTKMFHAFDKDHSGLIDCNELHQMLLFMGLPSTDKEVRAMMARADTDKSGGIDIGEFLAVMKETQGDQLGSPQASPLT